MLGPTQCATPPELQRVRAPGGNSLALRRASSARYTARAAPRCSAGGLNALEPGGAHSQRSVRANVLDKPATAATSTPNCKPLAAAIERIVGSIQSSGGHVMHTDDAGMYSSEVQPSVGKLQRCSGGTFMVGGCGTSSRVTRSVIACIVKRKTQTSTGVTHTCINDSFQLRRTTRHCFDAITRR